MRDALAPGTRVQDHVIEQWLRAVPDGHLYRVSHFESGDLGTLHEYLPRAWSVREGEMVVALTGRGPEFRAGLQRFLLRARQLKQVEHPALPTVTDLWSCNGTAYALFPAFTGQSLSEVVADQGGALQLSTAWPWLATCCDLAERLHAQGRIHGAWDPSAIWVLSDRKLVLPAPEVDGGSQQPSPWVALEQTVLAPGRAQRGPWTDVFGIGALAGFMLTGLNPSMLARQLASQRPVSGAEPGTLDSEVDGDADMQPQTGRLLTAIRASLSPNPRERPQDIAQFRAMIGLTQQAPVHRHLQVLSPKAGEIQAGGTPMSTARPVRPERPRASPPRITRSAGVAAGESPATAVPPRAPAKPAMPPTPAPESTHSGDAPLAPVELPTLPGDLDLKPPQTPPAQMDESSDATARAVPEPSDGKPGGESAARAGAKSPRVPALKLKSSAGRRTPPASEGVTAKIQLPPDKVPLPVPYGSSASVHEPDAADYPVVTTVLSGLPAPLSSTGQASQSGGASVSPRPVRKSANHEVWLAVAAALVVAMLWFFVDTPRMPELASAPPAPAADATAQLERMLERDPPAAGPGPGAAAAVAVPALAAPAVAAASSALEGRPATAVAEPAAPTVAAAARPADPAAETSAPASGRGEAAAAARTAPRLPRCTQALLEQSLGSGGAAAQVSRECR
jgi:hypothetical protein